MYLDLALQYLKKAEGGYLHHNNGEDDITTGYGIYKKCHKDALIFNYIDKIAKENGILKPSNLWTRQELTLIQAKMDTNKEIELSKDFYKKFFKNAKLEYLPEKMIVPMCAIYTNSPKIANKSLQGALNGVVEFYNLGFKPLAIDGILGAKSIEVMKFLKENDDKSDLLVAFFAIANKQNYKNLHSKYEKGLLNRVDNFVDFINSNVA